MDNVCKLAAQPPARQRLVDAVSPHTQLQNQRLGAGNILLPPEHISLLDEPAPSQFKLQGLLTSLGGLFDLRGQPEAQVRALMGAAMLLGEDRGRMRQLAEAPGAVKSLATAMRAGADPDAKLLATRIFAGLVSATSWRHHKFSIGVLLSRAELRVAGCVQASHAGW